MEPIRFRNRATGQVESEAIYGEAWLRWAYGTALGRGALRTIGIWPWFSRWYGWRMRRPRSRVRIEPFIRKFGIDSSEFLTQPSEFRSFNDFFARALRPGARPIEADPDSAVFPADGRHLGFANLGVSEQFFMKGQSFNLGSFLDDPSLARQFHGGAAVFSRLCPVDYHRFHFPVEGIPDAPRLINGWLWSVNPVALRRNLAYLWQNRRWITRIRTGAMGEVLMCEIGATNVGCVRHTYRPGEKAPKGGQKGWFEFGGSAVLTLFEPGRVRLCDDLIQSTAEGLELYARMGEVMARRAIESAPNR